MSLPPLPTQRADVPWPTQRWATAQPQTNRARFTASAQALWDLPEGAGHTQALLVVQEGSIVYEHYADGIDESTTLQSWSMAKSITQALTGLLVKDGRLDIDAPVAAREWQAAGDPRAAITTRHLLAMRSGLAWNEDYVDAGVSDVIEMLFASGKSDVAHFAAAKPLAHAPGSVFYYSSGTTNILARHLGVVVGGAVVGRGVVGGGSLRDEVVGEVNDGGAGMLTFMRERLFAPLGMNSATPRFDDCGTFIGSSFCFCTAQDFARFGLLYLRDGVWDGQRLLPVGWVDQARSISFRETAEANRHYGAQWWIADDETTFYASGYETQRIVVSPQKDALIVRLGQTPAAFGPMVDQRLFALLETLNSR